MNFTGDLDEDAGFGLGGSAGLGSSKRTLTGLFNEDPEGPPPGDNSSFKFEQPTRRTAPASPQAEPAQAAGGSQIKFYSNGQLTVYGPDKKPEDKGHLGVAVVAAEGPDVLLVYGDKKEVVAEATIGSGMQAKVDNQVFVVFYDNSKRFCCLRMADAGVASQCLQAIERSIQAAEQMSITELELGEGSTVAEHEFEVKIQYSSWLATQSGGAGSFVGGTNGKAVSFKIGESAVKGFDRAVTGMKKRGKRRVLMPAQLAVGAIGVATAPTSASLLFEITLQALRKPEHMRKSKLAADSPAAVRPPDSSFTGALVLATTEPRPDGQPEASAPTPTPQQPPQPQPQQWPQPQQQPQAAPQPAAQYAQGQYPNMGFPPMPQMPYMQPAAWGSQSVELALSSVSAKLDTLLQREPSLQLSDALKEKDQHGVSGEMIIAAVTRMVETDESQKDSMAADYITLLKSNMEQEKSKNQQLQDRLDALEPCNAELEQLRSQLQQAPASCSDDGMVNQIETQKAELDAAVGEKQVLAQEKQALELQLSSSKEQVDALSSKLQAVEAELQESKDQGDQANAEEIQKTEETAALTQQKLEETEQELATARERVQELMQSAEAAEANAQSAAASNATTIEDTLKQFSTDVQGQIAHTLEAVMGKFEKKIKEGEDYHGHQVHTCLR